jgi:hypothetical protein
MFDDSACFDIDSDDENPLPYTSAEECENNGYYWRVDITTCGNANIFLAAEPIFCAHDVAPYFQTKCCQGADPIEPCNAFH